MQALRTVALVLGLAGALLAQSGDNQSFCSAEHGELAPDSSDAQPVIRFGVAATQEPSWLTFQDKGKGYLTISRERLRYISYGSTLLDISRADITLIKEWESMGMPMGAAQVNTRSNGKWYFHKIQCNGGSDESAYQDLLDALQNFDSVSARIIAATPKPAPPPPPPQVVVVTPPPPPPPPPTGSIKFVTKPGGAQVYVDDRFKGTTSEQEGVLVVDDLKAGSYHVRVSDSGFKDWNQTQTLTAGENAEVQVKLVSAGPKPLGVSDVEEMLQNKVPRARIQKMLDDYGVDFALSNEIEQQLRSVGADDSLLLAIAKAKK